eukprot:2932891-Amphidinium_carterae.1
MGRLCKTQLRSTSPTRTSQDGRALEWAAGNLKSDREIVLAAVASNGRALKYAADGLKSDREIVLAAVKSRLLTGRALEHAASVLKGDREIVLEAVVQHGQSLQWAAEGLKGDLL